MLQLLDLARENAALRWEVTQLRQEVAALLRLFSQPGTPFDSLGFAASEDTEALIGGRAPCHQ
jgi:hypothetical protein